MKRLASVLLLLALCVAATGKEWKVIRFGVDPSYPPFESKAPSGELVGFDVELGKALCAKLNAECQWVENDFDGMIPALRARKIDAVLSDMAVTEKRLQQIDFTDPIAYSPTRMVAKEGSGLEPNAASLKGKSVGVEQGTVQETYARLYFETAGVRVISYQNQNGVYADLKSGRLDAALQDAVQAAYGFLKTPQGAGYAFAGPEIKDDKVLGATAAIGLRKGDGELRAALNAALADLRKDGTYARIAAQFFDFDPSPEKGR